jgi:pimeloyl-ACP methyl ester carboxylesterase
MDSRTGTRSIIKTITQTTGQQPTQTTLRVNGREYSLLVYGDSGPVVFCLHGFPDTNQTFRYQAAALLEKGFQVVCPCMPGYETSTVNDRARYDAEYLSDEILALIANWTADPVHLVGHDWGAFVAYAAVAKAADRFKSLCTMTIPYNMSFSAVLLSAPKQLAYSWYMAFFQLTGLSEWGLERDHFKLIDTLYKHWSPGWSVPAEQLDDIKYLLSESRVKRAALGYYRALKHRSATQYMNAAIKVPALLLRGEQDGCISSQSWKLIRPAYFEKGLRVCAVNAGHFLHQEKPDQVNQLIIEHVLNNQ